MSKQDQSYYDLDDVLPNQSPKLSPVQPIYRSVDTPPPFVVEDVSSSSHSPESTKDASSAPGQDRRSSGGRGRKSKGRKGRRIARAFGDGVLINALDPSRPDIAREAEIDPITVDSDEESDEPEDEPMRTNGTEGDDSIQVSAAGWVGMAQQALGKLPVDEDEDFELRDSSDNPTIKAENSSELKVVNGIHTNCQTDPEMSDTKPLPEKKILDLKPPPRPSQPSLLKITTDSFPRSPKRVYDDDFTTSPKLTKFTIEGNPNNTLPAMQMSPPRSASGQSPESLQTLPSLQSALNMDSASSGKVPFSLPGHSPTMTRPSPGQISHYGLPSSSYSQPSPGMSPPGPPSYPHWRTTPREGSMSTPSEYHSTPSSVTVMTPSSTTSYAPSIATVAEHNATHQRQDSLDESNSTTSPQSQGQLPNGAQPNGTFGPNSFKCSYIGCTAAPFQTQYLLNSHANVHSSSRPHFCPVPECPRGLGGKGFKRKNEMIRHGLVHDSPGYVCPFCPDQQHKYPRPDNLQRHVRVHHVEKDRDDPMLRNVLAQRPEGGNRGRRKRGGSTG